MCPCVRASVGVPTVEVKGQLEKLVLSPSMGNPTVKVLSLDLATSIFDAESSHQPNFKTFKVRFT